MLQHGEFEINGYRFGKAPAKVTQVVTNGVSWRVQDEPNPVGDGTMFGRDYADGSPMNLDISISGTTPTEAMDNHAAFHVAWRDDNRHEPGQLSVLRYRVHGKTKRVYGRPRDFSVPEGDLWALRVAQGRAVFQRADSLFYDDAPQEERLNILPGRTTGLLFPIAFPWGTEPGGPRQGVVVVRGNQPTPVTVTIYGPISDPSVSSGDWEISFRNLTLAYDQSVTVDSRQMAVTRNDGAPLAGKLSRRTFLAEARMQPGQQEIRFSGDDPTGTSKCVVSWHPATSSIGG